MHLRFCLLDADYIEEGEKALVRLWGVDLEGKTVCVLAEKEPYFYVLPKDAVKKAEEQIKKELEKKKQNIIRIETVKRKLGRDEKTFLKIFCSLPADVPKVRELVKNLSEVDEQYEYSINFYRRFLVDNDFSGMQWLDVEGDEIKKDYTVEKTIMAKNVQAAVKTNTTKAVKSVKTNSSDIDNIPKIKILSFEIETFEEAGKSRLTMISIVSDNLNKILSYRKTSYRHAETVSDEKQMIERFAEIVREQNPDIIISYNGDEFDFALMQERALELKARLALGREGSNIKFERRARTSSAHIAGRVHIDLYNFIANILGAQLQTETLSLDAVSAELLGDKKIGMELGQIMEDWREKKDLAKLAEYCLKDAELTLRLGNFVLPQIYELSKLVGQAPFDVSRMMYSQLVEWFLSRRAFALKTIIPNQPKFAEIEERRARKKYIGGYVKEPVGGIHEGLAVMDFRSLYPSIIATFNISPENLDCGKMEYGHKVPESKHWFCGEQGFVSGAARELIERRIVSKKKLKQIKNPQEWRKLKNEELSLKTVTNACYGYLAFPGSKWYCHECAESAAAFGRFFIKKIIADAEKEGFIIIYCDTDSLFVKLKNKSGKKNLEREVRKFLGNVNKSLPGMLELDLQGIYGRGIFIPRGAAPGTAKKRYALIDEKGTLTIRGLEKVRKDWSNVAKDTQEKVLWFVLKDSDVGAAVKYVQSVIKKIRQKKIPLRDLLIYEQLTKPLHEYRQIGPHVAAARKIQERGRPIGAGMIVIYAITKGKGSISERAEPIEDFSLNDIDNEYYISNQVVPAALRVLQVLGITEEQLLGNGLEKFVKKAGRKK